MTRRDRLLHRADERVEDQTSNEEPAVQTLRRMAEAIEAAKVAADNRRFCEHEIEWDKANPGEIGPVCEPCTAADRIATATGACLTGLALGLSARRWFPALERLDGRVQARVEARRRARVDLLVRDRIRTREDR